MQTWMWCNNFTWTAVKTSVIISVAANCRKVSANGGRDGKELRRRRRKEKLTARITSRVTQSNQPLRVSLDLWSQPASVSLLMDLTYLSQASFNYMQPASRHGGTHSVRLLRDRNRRHRRGFIFNILNFTFYEMVQVQVCRLWWTVQDSQDSLVFSGGYLITVFETECIVSALKNLPLSSKTGPGCFVGANGGKVGDWARKCCNSWETCFQSGRWDNHLRER